MLTPQSLKIEILANIKADFGEKSPLYQSLMMSEMEYEDSGLFSRKIWNVFSRHLKIFCLSENKKALDNNIEYLFKVADGIHSVQSNGTSDYCITEINILVRNNLKPDVYSTDEIVINSSVKIDTSKNYINQGGFGRIYKIHDSFLYRDFAYKFFDPSPFNEESLDDLVRRFIREGKKLLRYRHENIVAAYDVGCVSGSNVYYLKMEYIDGVNLLDFISCNTLDTKIKISIADQFISAMGYIHCIGDLHRDISYQNILVTKDNKVKLIDFGFSKGRDDTSYETTKYPLASKFAAPESTGQVKDSFSAEVYSIGAVLYSIFTQSKFHSQNILNLEEYDIPDNYKSVVLKCLETNPDNRIKKANHINWHLRNYLNKKSDTSIDLTRRNEYNLDWLASFINEVIIKIIFNYGEYPDFDSVQIWITEEFKSAIEDNAFIKEIHFSNLIFRLHGVKKIEYYKGISKYLDFSLLYEAYTYYINLPNAQKVLFCKTIMTIIQRKSYQEAASGMDDVPF